MDLREFTDLAIEEAESARIPEKLADERPVVCGYTIDGETSKDLDDGITLIKSGDNYLIQTSIADVASLVTHDSELFKIALDRVETRYLRFINKPMLPRVLSEFKLSLLQNKLTPAITFEIELQPDGGIINFKIRETAFKNIKRLSYGEFDKILREKTDDDYNLFSEMAGLAQALLERRRNKGALAIYDLKKGLRTNEEGIIVPIKKEFSHIANIVVQEFMILTNVTVAWNFAKNDVPLLFRNHTAKSSAPRRGDILEQINTAILNPVHLDSLRSRGGLWFNKANYSPVLKGHFGLNEAAYSHITSPIRRMADLINQHLIKAYIRDEKPPFNFERLCEISEHINRVIEGVKEEKAEVFKEKLLYESKYKLNYSTVSELIEMEQKDFAQVLKTAAKNNLLFDNLEETLTIRLERNKIDANMIYVLLFETSKKDPAWKNIKEKALEFIFKNNGTAVQLLNILLQKGRIYDYDSEAEETSDGFAAKSSVFVGKKQIKTHGYSVASKKKDAVHYSACELLRIMLGFSPQKDKTEQTEQIDESESSNEYTEDIESEAHNESERTIEKESEAKESAAEKLKRRFENKETNEESRSDNLINKTPLIIDDESEKEISEQKNYVGDLNIICTRNRNFSPPDYEFAKSGPDHSLVFKCIATLRTPEFTVEEEDSAGKKKDAKRKAARKIIKALAEKGIDVSSDEEKPQIDKSDNFVGLLEEYCQKTKTFFPNYNFRKIGPQHNPTFECSLSIMINDETKEFIAYGSNKKIAKQNAAEKSLKALGAGYS